MTNLEAFTTTDNEHFVFSMLVKLARNLILVKSGEIPPRMQTWQAGKLRRQAMLWKEDNLILFYEALYKIEAGTKTGTTPFSLKESLAILACHFL